MQIVEKKLSRNELQSIADRVFGNMVKAVVDIERGLLALDAELHSDLESFLIKNGSKQTNLWGINLFPELPESDFVEFDSMINMRPSQGNRSRGVESQEVRRKILEVVHQKVVL
jgi:hypothetical protein